MTTKTPAKDETKPEAKTEHHTVAELAKRLDAVETALRTGDPHSFALTNPA